jgi:hypothetical protein
MVKGYRTYSISVSLLLVVLVEKGMGFDIPGVEVGNDWLTLLLNAMGLGTLRAGIAASSSVSR